MGEKVKYIETLEGAKPEFEVSKKSLAIFKSRISGLFFYRDNDKIIVKPIRPTVRRYMESLVGIEQLTLVTTE